jgi:hypothetical protein
VKSIGRQKILKDLFLYPMRLDDHRVNKAQDEPYVPLKKPVLAFIEVLKRSAPEMQNHFSAEKLRFQDE